MRSSSKARAILGKAVAMGTTVVLLASPASASLFFWDTQRTGREWSNHNNWAGPQGQVPDSTTDTVYVQGVTSFDPEVDLNYRIGTLFIRLGGDLYTGDGTRNNLLTVTAVKGGTGRTAITDSGSSLTVYPSTNHADFDTDDLSIGSGAVLQLRDGGMVQIDDKLSVSAGARIDGAGSIELSRQEDINDPVNHGLIRALGGTCTIRYARVAARAQNVRSDTDPTRGLA